MAGVAAKGRRRRRRPTDRTVKACVKLFIINRLLSFIFREETLKRAMSERACRLISPGFRLGTGPNIVSIVPAGIIIIIIIPGDARIFIIYKYNGPGLVDGWVGEIKRRRGNDGGGGGASTCADKRSHNKRPAGARVLHDPFGRRVAVTCRPCLYKPRRTGECVCVCVYHATAIPDFTRFARTLNKHHKISAVRLRARER